MIPRRILIAEDDWSSSNMMRELLVSEGYDVTCAENGQMALEFFNDDPFPVVITDLSMPVLDGRELVKKLNAFQVPPVIFIETAHYDPALIIEVMKLGVYDYLIKPVDLNDLLLKIQRAFELAELNRLKIIQERERVVRLESQLSWYRWEDRVIHGTGDTLDKTMLSNMQKSFNQGTGFGAMVSLIELISKSAKKDGSFYTINSEVFEYLIESGRMARQALDTFRLIDEVLNSELDTESVNFARIVDLIEERVAVLHEKAVLKKQRLVLSDVKMLQQLGVEMNRDLVIKVLDELLLNAMKYSRDDSVIVIMPRISESECVISILNDPVPDDEGRMGIPIEYENLVFEPFIRLNKKIQSRYQTLDYGLGLMLVENIIQRHGGSVEVGNVKDYTNLSKGEEVKVMSTVRLPVIYIFD